jgi:hypothetical protein
MANYYSDHFSGVNAVTLATDNSVLDNSKILATGVGHGRVHYKRAELTLTTLVDGDFVRMMQFKSGDRLNQLNKTNTDSGSTGTVALGFYKTGRSHDGEGVETDIIVTGDVFTTAYNKLDIFSSGAATADLELHRGKALWEIASFGSASYTEDPMEDWDLVVECIQTFADPTTFFFEAFYTSGD